jgi:transposase
MTNTTTVTVLAIDLAKEVFQLHGVNERGKAIIKKKLRRSELLEFVANLPKCLIAMEACGGAHYWAREFQKFGHEAKLISPQFVKPFVKSNKTDANDAEAIAEAAVRPSMRFVPIKQIPNQDIQNLHRVRERLIRNRTALSNEIRGLLLEYGIAIPKTISKLYQLLTTILDNPEEQRVSPMSRQLFRQLLEELKNIEKEAKKYESELETVFKGNEAAQRIGKIEGVGVVSATAVIATVSDPNAFKNGREFSAWLGLVPKQNSSGGKTVLQGISKRGDVYLRTMLINGARAALRWAPLKSDKKSKWITEKMKTRGFNKACVALANRNARVIWALLAKGENYKIINNSDPVAA